MPVMRAMKVERFFRAAAGLDVDHDDEKRYNDFVNRKIHDLRIRAAAAAQANGRDMSNRPTCRSSKGCRSASTIAETWTWRLSEGPP